MTHAEASRKAIGLPVQCAVVLAMCPNKSDHELGLLFLPGVALLFVSIVAAGALTASFALVLLTASGAAAATTVILLFLRAIELRAASRMFGATFHTRLHQCERRRTVPTR